MTEDCGNAARPAAWGGGGLSEVHLLGRQDLAGLIENRIQVFLSADPLLFFPSKLLLSAYVLHGVFSYVAHVRLELE